MSATTSRIVRVLFAVYVLATALHIAFILTQEPFSFDAWNIAVDTNAEPATPGRFFGYWWHQYTHSNPRLGQALTYLTYKLDYVAEVAIPLSFLAITLAVTVLGLGRWPWRRGRDLAVWAIVIGFAWFALPQIGRNLFCRAYAANYVFGAAVQLWFLVPLRLARSYENASLGRCIAYAGFGLVAGMCNEHTGPTLIAFLAGFAWWQRRQGERPKLLWFGGIGALVGFLLIFFAPGQGERYDGLAQKASLPMRLLQRGITGNLDIFRDYVIHAAPVLGLLVILLILAVSAKSTDEQVAGRKRALQLIAIALVAGSAMAATLFVSPKLGARFYLVSCSLLLAGFVALLDVVVTRTRVLVPFVILAVFASLYAGYRTIPMFIKVGPQGAARMAALAASKPGALFVADAFEQVEETWWYIGDDFRDFNKRELVANYFGLARVFFRGYDIKGPLGMLGVKMVPRYTGESGRVTEHYAFDLGFTRGFDIAGIHKVVRTSVDLARTEIAPEQLARYELLVEFVGAWPPMPRHRILVARWNEGQFEGYSGSIVRLGRGTTRELMLPPLLAGKPFEIYITHVGSEPRRLGTTDGTPLRYVPWRSGVYWALACDATECWVIAASRHRS